ncbi:lipopolysaccharide biosynthesis protein [Aquabacterium sp.]|uniref:lipopolysaccharide biosynthesis protein n=1 Tax=Aquabacterium sp. TaxID=1872578 RepID=UPI0035AF1643
MSNLIKILTGRLGKIPSKAHHKLAGTLFSAIKLVFHGPFETNTEHGRANERLRRVLISALTSAGAKVITVGTALITVPLTLNYLGTERYGLWMTLSSVIAMLSFADFGIGNGVLNLVADAKGRDDEQKIKQVVSSGAAILTAIGICAATISVATYPHVDWPALFHVTSQQAKIESGPAAITFLLIFSLNIPVALVARVQAGLQESYRASIWQCAGSLLSLGLTILVISYQAGLPWLVLSFAGSPTICGIANGIHYIATKNKQLMPKATFVEIQIMKQVARSGLLFFGLQLVAALTFASDNFLTARILGAASVANYAVPDKLFSLITTTVLMATQPLWPAYGEALARHDIGWVKSILKRSVVTAVFYAGTFGAILIAAGPKIIHLWAGPTIDTPLPLILGLAIWKVIEAAGLSIAALMNGAHIVTPQIVMGMVTCGATLALKSTGLSVFGIESIPYAMSIAFFIFTLLPSAYTLHIHLKEKQRR